MWLKSYQRLGYFPKVWEVPAVVVGHVRGALGLADEVELRRAAPMSASRHRAFVRKRLGVVHDTARVRQVAEETIRTEVNTGFFQTVTGQLDAAARTVAQEAIELEAGTPERSVLEAVKFLRDENRPGTPVHRLLEAECSPT
ncbi:hypothetical protein [Nonomuraea sp. KM88]|uniref:hypothetical protein n=1 Tax=Nonomuraea sp. KM88 TaxID=3457427 RepID=UPI003FCEBA9F